MSIGSVSKIAGSMQCKSIVYSDAIGSSRIRKRYIRNLSIPGNR